MSKWTYKEQDSLCHKNQLTRETGVKFLVRLYQRPEKMVLDASLLNTPYYKVRIKDKLGQAKERIGALPYIMV